MITRLLCLVLTIQISELITFRIAVLPPTRAPAWGEAQICGKLTSGWYHELEGHSDVLKCGSELGQKYVTLYNTMEIGQKGNLR